MIRKFTLSVDYNWWLKHLDTQLNEPTIKKINKSPPKFLSQRIRKRC